MADLTGSAAGSDGRRRQLADNLADVTDRLAAAERAAGRPAGDVHLVVVTKTFPASDVRLLASLGVRDVGESREPEAGATAAACADLPLRWHQVGQVQTNKAAAVARWADVVHSVDRRRLVDALARAAQRSGRRLACLLQVDLTDGDGSDGPHDPTRGGARPREVPELAEAVAAHEALDLVGVMAVAPRGSVGTDARAALGRLARISDDLRREHPAATWISAGMSGDLEEAVAIGATHVRIGRAVLGDRRYVR